jgi:hypothetical protein
MHQLRTRQQHYRLNLGLLILCICSILLLGGAIVYQVIAKLTGIKANQIQ